MLISVDHLCILQFSELKRQEREHAKEKQKLVKDKDAGWPFFETCKRMRFILNHSMTSSQGSIDESKSNES